jgi:serine/threonine protein kinase
MAQHIVQIGDIAQVDILGQNYRFYITDVDSQGIHTGSYLIVPQGDIWQIQGYSLPHDITFVRIKTFKKCRRGQRTEIEAENYEKLGPHPNFLEYYGSYDSPVGKCIVLEYLSNFSTFEEMFGTSPDNFLEIVTQSYAALDYLHSKGLTHGDLGSPINILWDHDKNRVVIIDLEGRSIDEPRDIIPDNRDLSLLLWIILDGDIPQEIYEETIEDDDYDGFIDHIEQRRIMYDDPETQEAITMILDRMKTSPS